MKRILLVVLLSALVMLFGACTQPSSTSGPTATPQGAVQGPGVAAGETEEMKIPAIDKATGKAVWVTSEELAKSTTLVVADGVIEVEEGFVCFITRGHEAITAEQFISEFDSYCRIKGKNIKLAVRDASSPYLHLRATVPEEQASPSPGKPLIEQVMEILGMMTNVDEYD